MAATKAKKTDNSYLAQKVYLRQKYLPENPVVLDCYAGAGLIWKKVQENLPSVNIQRLAIEKEPNKGKFHLTGNNMAFIGSMDLSRFNVIDLDAYGVPYEQVKTLFDRQYHGTVFITFIQSVMGALPYGLLLDVGFSKSMIKKCPTIFYRRGWDHWLEFLARNGVTRVAYIQHERKYYAVITI